MIHKANTNQKKTGQLAILSLDKAGFRTRKIIRDKEGYYINEKAVTCLRQYNNPTLIRTPKRMQKYTRQIQIKLQGEIGKFTVIIGEFKQLSISKLQTKQEENQ